ncbi:MAG: hypothetical protein VW082_07790 [Candidatus Nanopelagicales bacterium]|jgi:tetratricopeptide (TPR) repeat protein
MADGEAMRDQAAAVLADARQRLAAAESAGRAYGIALQRTRAAQALLVLDDPQTALEDLEQAGRFVDMLAADGDHEHQYLLRAVSPGLPPPDEEMGDLDSLRAMILVSRALALTHLHRWADARVAVDQARPLARGWRRRDLRKALDQAENEIARADGAPGEAITAIDRTLAQGDLPQPEQLSARYERAAHLADEGRFDEAIRDALTLIRDAGDDDHVTSRARQVLGASLAALGRVDDALAALTAAFEGFVRDEEDAAIANAAPGLAWLLGESGDHVRAITTLQTGIEAATRIGDRLAIVDLESALGAAYDAHDEPAAAVAAFGRAIALAENLHDEVRAADARHGEAIVRGGQPDPHELVEALSLLDAAAVGYDRQGLRERAAECQHEAAALLARRGSYSAALARYRTALSAYEHVPEVLLGEDPGAPQDCIRNIALLESLAGDPQQQIPSGAFASGGHRMQHATEVE